MNFLTRFFGGSKAPKTDIHDAVEKGDVKVVKLLLKRHPELISSERKGWLPLHTAARAGHMDVVEVLLANGANVNAKSSHGKRAWHYAMDGRHDEVAKLLLDSK